MCDWRQAVQYRNRAAMLRTIADDIPHDDHKRSLRCIADYYELMATCLERAVRRGEGILETG
jgi:hypothetical protein